MSITGHPPNESPGRGAAVAIRRYVNDEIARTAIRFDLDDGGRFEFLCECGDLSCNRRVKLTLPEYRASEPGSIVRS
ncbi:MAG TPA: hypothetical protein VFU56_08540 [Gaiellaceae bacterium]|nr:hypothetical protein [Gaiellaceae bacterium]